MSEQGKQRSLVGRPPEGSIKAEIGGLTWKELVKSSPVNPPQSLAVEIRHEGYVYRGSVSLVEEQQEEVAV